MIELTSLAFLFAFGCLLGWEMEALFRRIYSGEWINPGFLTGPALPLYGFSLCLLHVMSGLDKIIVFGVEFLDKAVLILLMTFAVTLLEYIAGLIFIKGLKTKLWDYTNEKFNLQGIICLKYSLLWMALCALYYFFVNPVIEIFLLWFEQNIGLLFFLGMFYGIFFVDLGYSFRLVSKIKQFAEENHILVHYEKLKTAIRKTAREQKEKYRYLFAFSSRTPLYEHLKKYLSLIQAFTLEKDEEKSETEKESQKDEEETGV